ncbi:MAG: VOC family protein [Planctomycetota bacterium]
MRHVSIVPALRVRSLDAALPLWKALGFELAFAFAGAELVEEGRLEEANFARLDAGGEAPVSVFLEADDERAPATVHLMLAAPADVDEAAQRLGAGGFAVIEPPTDQPWGMRDLRVRDADGNLVIAGAALPA